MDEKLKLFFRDHLLVEIGVDAQEETNIFEEGLIDSFGFVQLVAFLEKEYGISIANEELISSSLTTYASIRSFLQKKLNDKHPSH